MVERIGWCCATSGVLLMVCGGQSFSGSSRLYVYFCVFNSIEGFQNDNLSFLNGSTLLP